MKQVGRKVFVWHLYIELFESSHYICEKLNILRYLKNHTSEVVCCIFSALIVFRPSCICAMKFKENNHCELEDGKCPENFGNMHFVV